MHENTALLLEGGSLRCLFTAGVLDVFQEAGLAFPAVAGVSAGSLCAINYVSGQPGRTARVNLRFVNDPRYLGLGNLLRRHSVFNFDFLFGEVSHRLEPLDYEAFCRSPQRLFAFTTDLHTGESVAHEKGVSSDILLACRASCSMPLLSTPVQVDGHLAMDGAVAQSIPLPWALQQGYTRIVLVLTRQEGYRKRPVSPAMAAAYEMAYRPYPAFVQRCRTIPERYNVLQQQIARLERSGRIFVIRPQEPVDVSRTEQDTEKLRRLYRRGQEEARRRLPALQAYLNAGRKENPPEPGPGA